MGKYKIKSGDSLSKIAKANGVTVKQLQEWNGIKKADAIREGQEIIVSEPVSPREIAVRQAFMESNFNPSATNSLGATGLYQIRSNAMQDFNKATGRNFTKDSLLVADKNADVRDWYMDNLLNASWNQHEQDEKVKYAKAIAAYNWGRGNLLNYLNKAKEKTDIYNSLDWINDLPEETRNYVKFIINGDSVNLHKNPVTYTAAKAVNPKTVSMIESRQEGGTMPSDNTKVVVKEKIAPVKREFPYTIASLVQGNETSSSNTEKLERQGQIEKEQKDLEQGLETISAALDYTSPSYWINRNGGDLNTAEALGIDLLSYIAIGGLAGLAERGAVKLTKKGVQKTAKFATVSSRAASSDKVAALRGNWNPEFKLNTGKPTGPVDYEGKVIPVRQRLIEWYSSPEYKQRLKQAGFTDAQADERVQQLIANTHVKVSDGALNPAEYGLTSIELENQTPIRITVDGKQLTNDADFNSTVLEELLHASEFNGFTVSDLMQDPKFLTLPKQQQELLLSNIKKLHNDVAYRKNTITKPSLFSTDGIEQTMVQSASDPKKAQEILSKLSPAKRRQALTNAITYYGATHETRARAIGSILNDPRLATEWDRVWINTPQKEAFRNSVLTAPLLITQQEKHGGKINYLDYFKQGIRNVMAAN